MLTKEWIGGFVSGEGGFTFNGRCPLFQVGVSIKDLEILKEIKKTIGFGKLCITKNQVCVYYIKTKEGLKLVEFLDGYIKGDKLIDFENWKLGIKFIKNIPKKEYTSKEDRLFLDKLKPTKNKRRVIYTEYPKHKNQTKKCIRCNYDFIPNSMKQLFCEDCKFFYYEFRKEERIKKGDCVICGSELENKKWKICLKCRIKARKRYNKVK